MSGACGRNSVFRDPKPRAIEKKHGRQRVEAGLSRRTHCKMKRGGQLPMAIILGLALHWSWRFLGNAGEVPTAAPFASAPHHPLF